MSQITSSKIHPTRRLKEGTWHFARTVGKPGRLFHKFGGILHEFWAGEPLFADGSNKMRGQLRLEKGGLVDRHIRIGAGSWKAGTTAPTAAVIATFPTLSFDTGKDDAALYSLVVPWRRKVGTDMGVLIHWYHTDAGQEEVGDKAEWNLTYLSVAHGDDPTAAGTNITQESAGAHDRNKVIETEFTTKILDANIADDEVLGLKLWRDGTNDTLVTPAILLQVHIKFTMDKLGGPLA